MLGGRAEDAPPGPCRNARDGQIVRLGAPTHEVNLLVPRADGARDRFSRLVEGDTRSTAPPVRRRGVAEGGAGERLHRLSDLLPHRRRRRVIEVDCVHEGVLLGRERCLS